MFGMNGWCKEPNNAGNGSDCPKNAQNSEDRTTGDLISRAAAIDALDEINAEIENGYGFQYEKWRVHFRVLPSAQPEIVRCKDCIYCEPNTEKLDAWCNVWGNTTICEGYCFYGERKNDE